MIRYWLLLVLPVLFSFSSFSQSAPESLRQRLEEFVRDSPQEELYIHTDKPYYSLGDTIWFKAYLLEEATHLSDTFSNVIYLDFVRKTDGKIIQHKILRNENGFANGSLFLSDTLKGGAFEIVGFTNWMRNVPSSFFRKELLVYTRTKPIHSNEADVKRMKQVADLQFFPEGGNLVAGLQNRIAFKAVNEFGKGVDVDVYVISDHGDTVAQGKSQHLGMGKFNMLPKNGEHYYATLDQTDSNKKFDFPEVQSQGCTMLVNYLNDKDFVKVIIRNNFLEKDRPMLIAHQRGTVIYASQTTSEGNAFAFDIPKKDIPDDGVVHLTAFNKSGLPICERLIYHNADRALKILVQPDQESYGPRKKVVLDVTVKDKSGTPVQGNFSISVTDGEQVYTDGYSETIQSYLNLSSSIKSAKAMLTDELRGGIEQPAYYFSDNPEASLHLDILLMTQGWRKFIWSEVLEKKTTDNLYPIETGLMVTGKALQPNGKAFAKPLKITLGLSSGSKSEFIMTDTDQKGNFTFSNLVIWDSTTAVVQARKENGGKDISIMINKLEASFYKPVQFPWSPLLIGVDRSLEETLENYLEELRQRADRPIILKEVEITTKRQVPDNRRIRYGGSYTTVKVDDENCVGSLNILQFLQGRTAGVDVRGNPPDQIWVRGANADFVLDGMLVPIDVIKTVLPCNVEAIDILHNQFVGGRSRYAISVLTKFSNPNYDWTQKKTPGVMAFTIKGYEATREFYSPRYEIDETQTEVKPDSDFRSTLYWNPMVSTDADGEAEIIFWNSDARTKVNVSIEGMSKSGMPGVGSFQYKVQ